MSFLEDLAHSEIAGRMGVSQMHVSRLIRRALGRLEEAASEGDCEWQQSAASRAG